MKRTILFLITALSVFASSCNNETKKEEVKGEATVSAVETKQDRNKKIVMASMESFMKGDLDAVFKDAAPGFVDYSDGSIPPINSVDSLKSFIKVMQASITDYIGENLKYYADGDHVIVHGDWGGTFKNDFMGIKATGKPIKFKDVDIFKFNDEGKITEHHAVQNLQAILMTAK